MSAIGRLWRRAPAWRLCLFTAVAATALTVMFPPVLPRPVVHHASAPGARYTPQADAAPTDYSAISRPAFGAGRTGVIAFSGRALPLPPGVWQVLALAHTGGATPVQVMSLGRLDQNRLTGLLFAIAPSRVAGIPGLLNLPELCFQRPTLADAVIPPPEGDTDPHDRECWTLGETDMNGPDVRKSKDPLFRAGIDRLDQLGDTIPDHMLTLRYFRSDASGFLIAMLFLPPAHTAGPAAMRKLRDWATQSVARLHLGFDSALTVDPAQQGLRDPG